MKTEDCFARIGNDPLIDAFGNIPARPHMRAGPMRAEPVSSLAFEEWAPHVYRHLAGRPLSLYLHTPFCHHRCSFCPFFINTMRDGISGRYAELLRQEIVDTAWTLAPSLNRRSVQAVYFGGGTPSDLSTEDMASVLAELRERFPLAEDAEVTIEGRVRDFTAEKARRWIEAGANRFSLGVQSTDTRLRRKLGRLADRAEIAEVLNGLTSTGAVVVVDLIFGLPGQTSESLLADVDFLAEETSISGLDLYDLKQFPGSPLVQAVEAGRLPKPADRAGRARIYAAACQRLEEKGFTPHTLQHWRRTGRERSLYNRLAKQDSDILPFGSAAGGRLGRISLSQHRDIDSYAKSVLAGKKPLQAFVGELPDALGRFRQALATAIESRRLPPLGEWPSPLQNPGQTLLSQWAQAGLVCLAESEGPAQPVLTRAGAFWAQQLQTLLNEFANDCRCDC